MKKGKVFLRIICVLLSLVILVPCAYLWVEMVSSRVSGEPLTVAGRRLAVTGWELAEEIPSGTLLVIGTAEQIAPEDVLLVDNRTDGETVCRVLLAGEEELWVSYGTDRLPERLAPEQVLGKAELVSPLLGEVVVFLGTPVGLSLFVLVPVVLVLLLQILAFTAGRRASAEDRKK